MERKKGVMEQEIKQMGESLRQRRKEMNVSLKEVENATSIRMTYLQALEEGETEKLISPVYAQGFFKQYAIFLGMDGDKIVRENPHIFGRSPAQDFAYGIGTLEVRDNPSAGVKWVPNAFWIGVFMATLMFAWYIAKFFEIL